MPITYDQTGVTYDSTTYTYDGEIFSPSVFPVAGVFVRLRAIRDWHRPDRLQ